MCNIDDRETVDQISENVYVQYFLGYSSFTNQGPFDASLFGEFRKRLGSKQLNEGDSDAAKQVQGKVVIYNPSRIKNNILMLK